MPHCQKSGKIVISPEIEVQNRSIGDHGLLQPKVSFEESGGDTLGGSSVDTFNCLLQQSFAQIAKRHRSDLEELVSTLGSASGSLHGSLLQSPLEYSSERFELIDGAIWVDSGIKGIPPSKPTVSELACNSMVQSLSVGNISSVRSGSVNVNKISSQICRESVVSVEARQSTLRTSAHPEAHRQHQSTNSSRSTAIGEKDSLSSKKSLAFKESVRSTNSAIDLDTDREDSDKEFGLLTTWRKQSQSSKNKWKLKMARNVSHEDLNVLRKVNSVDDNEGQALFRYIIMTPGNPFRFVWDILGAILVMYDFIMIPLSVFELYEEGLLTQISYAMLGYWSVDMVLCFVTGYLDNRTGSVVISPRMIAKRYLETWFVLDLLILLVDWIAAVTEDVADDNTLSYGTFLRVVRILRCVRLIRLLKVSRVFVKIRDMVSTEVLAMMMDVSRLTSVICVFSHFIACIFYELGKTGQRSGEDNWLDEVARVSAIRGNQGTTSKTEYLYVTSVHWSLTQFTPASMEVTPRNTRERIYAIVVIILGFLVFSSMISEITSSLVQMRKLGEDEKKQFWKLRRFLLERGVPYVLSTRIRQYLESTVQMHGRHVREDNVGILRLLSDQLYKELQYSIKIKHIANHTLFDYIISVTNATILRLTSSMNFVNLACADTLFFQNESSESMYFVVVGDMEYIQEFGIGGAQRGGLHMARHSVTSRSWLCEPVLWTVWNHVGDLHAISECNLIAIDSNAFVEVVKTNPAVHGLVAAYAVQFIQDLRQMSSRELTDLCNQYNYKHLTYTMRVFVEGDDSVSMDGNGLVSESSESGDIGSASTGTVKSYRGILSTMRRVVKKHIPGFRKRTNLDDAQAEYVDGKD